MITIFLLFSICLSRNINEPSTNNFVFLENDQFCVYDSEIDYRLTSSRSVCIYNSTFQSIRETSSRGGAVYISYFTTDAQINHFENCNFTNCYSLEGGVIYIIVPQQTITEIYNCKFEKNAASANASCIYLQSTFSLFECHFFNNGVNVQNKEIYGGTLYFSVSEGTMNRCQFINGYSSFISSTDVDYRSSGGLIYFYQTNITFEECIFHNNTLYTSKKTGKPDSFITQSTGAVISVSSSHINFTTCNFDSNYGISNESITTGPCYGCAIYARESSLINVEMCNFTNNLLYELGRLSAVHGMSGICAFLVESNATFFGCLFKNNTSYSYDTYSNSGFISKGGAVAFDEAAGSFENCVFLNNIIYTYGTSKSGLQSVEGGAVYSYSYYHDYETSFISCSFTNNSVYFPGPSIKIRGGAVYMGGGILKKCCFSDNTALYGGHIYYSQNRLKSYITIDECSFKTTHDNNGYMKSLIYIYASQDSTFANSFTNNVLSVNNVEKLLLFNGSALREMYNYTDYTSYYVQIKLKFSFENNCVSSYDGIIFKNDSFPILDENGDKNVTFEEFFGSVCTKSINNCPFYYNLGPSEAFTYSDVFTNSEIFSKSKEFEKINTFSKSNALTDINSFTKSNTFSKSNVFSKNNEFSIHYTESIFDVSTMINDKEISANVKGKKKIKFTMKSIVLCCIACFEVILIALVVALIIIIYKNTRNQLTEPLLDDSS